MRKFTLISCLACLACLALALLASCSSDENLIPTITRIEANVECGVAPVDVQFVAFVTGGDPTPDPTGANAPLDVTWDFMDGETGIGSVAAHRFMEPGEYDVTATVTDDDGDSDTMNIFVEILSDSLFVMASNDTTITASMAFFTEPSLGTSNGSGGNILRETIVINEVLAFNESAVVNPANGAYEPLLELYNPTTEAVPLYGWSMTNDSSEPGKWHFAVGQVMQPGEILIIWVDNRDIAGDTHTNFHMTNEFLGPPEEYTGSIYLYNANEELIDRVQLLNQRVDVSFGHLPDASDDGLVTLSVDANLCGFDPETGLYTRFNFSWDMDDALDSVYPQRAPEHVFTTDDAGQRSVIVTVFDTFTSVTRADTVTITVELPVK